MLHRPGDDEYAPFYGRYIRRVPDGDVIQVLALQFETSRALLASVTAVQARYRYAPEKWSVKEVVGHLSDTERVMAYRALRIGRGDTVPLAGFDENDYVRAADFDTRTLGSILDEWAAVRQATLRLLEGLPPAAGPRRGEASGHPVSVRALAYIIAGHELHHRALLHERYGLAPPA